MGLMDDGKIKWSADGAKLTVIDDEGVTDVATYQLDGQGVLAVQLTATSAEESAPERR